MDGRPNWTAAMVTRLHVGEVLGVLRKTAISAQLRNGSLTTGRVLLSQAVAVGSNSALRDGLLGLR